MQSGHKGFATPLPPMGRDLKLPDPIEGLTEEAIYGGGIQRTRAARQIAAGFGPNKAIEPGKGEWTQPIDAPLSSKQRRAMAAEEGITHDPAMATKEQRAARIAIADTEITRARTEIEAARKERRERMERIARERWER